MTRQTGTLRLGGALLAVLLGGCAGLTGITNWKEVAVPSRLSKERTFRTATVALAQVGSVSFSDAGAGTISGQCAQSVDASIIVSEEGGKTTITIKSKINVADNMMEIDTGKREKCLSDLQSALSRAGA